MASQRWIPLESNPAVLNKYIKKLGAGGDWQFNDILGLDDELLQMVPQTVIAVMLLYPLTEKAKGQDIGTEDEDYPKAMYFMKQTISNACGTVALVHALANNEDKIPFAADKSFQQFLNKTKDKSPEEKAKLLEEDEGLGLAHEESAQQGDTQAPSRDTSVRPHFITFLHKDGKLYEMDGRKNAPVVHGPTSPETLLKDAVKVVKKFIERDPEEINFTLMALAKSE